MHEITYSQVGDYLIPNLTIGDEPQPSYGKYGMQRKQFLKQHRKGTYAQLILSMLNNSDKIIIPRFRRKECFSTLV